MLQFILRRVLLLIPILFGVSLVTFILVRSLPGDPASIAIGVDQRITPEQRALVEKSYGLDQPKPVQYIRWMEHVLQGDLGRSLSTKRPLSTELQLRLPVTVQLAVMAGILGIVPALAVGVLAAMKRNSVAAVMMRNTRSAVLEVINQDYVRVARAKGLSNSRVLIRHILPNSALPIITIAGIQIAGLLGGTVIIEQIFGLPGLGQYIYTSISRRDYPVVQGVTLVLATIFVTVSMLVDILYAVVDPRLRKA
jgi:ABC-type dipeptide/oligopeptide/nickel transport system permease component